MKTKLAALLFSLLSAASWGGVDTDTDENGVILAGHDTVAYHTESRAVLGNPEITAVYNDAIYRFASKKNRNLFVADPETYAPAYGGFCAYGATFGKKFEVDGKAFQVVDGQLYVNKNLSVYKTWKKDIPGNIVESDAHWPRIENIPKNQL
jgi:hypothetical protein